MCMGTPSATGVLEDQRNLYNAILLQYPHPSLSYIVVINTLAQAAKGVLTKDQGDGLRPLAFMIRALNPVKQWWLVYERELAAIAYWFIGWWYYLEVYPRGVTIMMDYKRWPSWWISTSCYGLRKDGFIFDYSNQPSQKLFTNRARQMSSSMHSHGACHQCSKTNSRNDTSNT